MPKNKISLSQLQPCEPLTVPKPNEIPEVALVRMAGEFKSCASRQAALAKSVKETQYAD